MIKKSDIIYATFSEEQKLCKVKPMRHNLDRM
jgi:hypothetical protein